MLIELDFNSEKPIYEQLYEAIILAMANGELAPYESLPSVRSLGVEIGINLHTVNKAYNLLKEEGYIQMDRRKGALVSSLPIQASPKTEAELEDAFALLTAKAKLMGHNEAYLLNRLSHYYKQTGGVQND